MQCAVDPWYSRLMWTKQTFAAKCNELGLAYIDDPALLPPGAAAIGWSEQNYEVELQLRNGQLCDGDGEPQ